MNDAVRKTARGDSQISHVHVIGAGTMGGDIAAVAALNGFLVSLSDRDAGAIDKAIARAAKLFARRLKTEDASARAMVSVYTAIQMERVLQMPILLSRRWPKGWRSRGLFSAL